ncbi:hypothetical protein JCM16303_001163 [Sporobolomyces ruberrimus]
MPPPRSQSAKPGGLRLPGTFTSPPSSSSPSPTPPTSVPRRAASAEPTTTTTTTRKLPGTSSVPASRLTAKPTVARGNDGPSTGLLSSFGSSSTNVGSGRLDRAKSSPGRGVTESGGQNRLERLGLNRASTRQVTRSPSPEESGERTEEERSERPRPSWGRSSSDEEEMPRIRSQSRAKRRSISPTLNSSPPPPRHRRSPRPPSPSQSARSSVIPPVETSEEKKPAEEEKGTLFGSLWNKAATAWNGGDTADPNTATEPRAESPRPAQSKEDPFRKTKRPAVQEEHEGSPPPSRKGSLSRASPTRHQQKKQTLAEPAFARVDPITYHRPPEIHPRNILFAPAATTYKHNDPYDWLGDQPKSPLDAYLFHRQAGRMATKKVRLRRPPAVGMATAPAILAGSVLAGTAIHGYAHARHPPSAPLGSHPGPQPPNGSSPGVFVSEFSGPVQAFSQAPHQPSLVQPVGPAHPGTAPVPPPIPPGYQPSTSTSTAGLAGPTMAPGASLGQTSAPHPPNPNSLPSFPTRSQPPTSVAPAVPSQPQPRAQPRPAFAPLPQSFSSAPAPIPYSYPGLAPPPLAPLAYPAPVFTAPAPIGPPASIATEGPVGDVFKTALAKKLFGTQLSDAPAPLIAAGPYPSQPPSFNAAAPQAQVPSFHQTQPHTEPRLPTPAAPTTPVSQSATNSTSTGGSQVPALIHHGVLPPMPIPQSITPPPRENAPSSISFAPMVPMAGSSDWMYPPSASAVTPLPTPGPVALSPAPSTRSGVDALDKTPSPDLEKSDDTREVDTQVEGDAASAGSENEQVQDEDADPDFSSSTPQSSGSPVPTVVSREEPTPAASTFLSLPTFAALTTPLPPSPSPSLFSSSSIISPTSSPAPTLAPSSSPTPTLPPVLPSVKDDPDDLLPLYSIPKDLPHPPASSPSLAPLPPSSDFSSIVLSPPHPSESPALPPLPPCSPTPTIAPRPFSSSSSVVPNPSSPPPPSSVSLDRAPSLSVSIESVPSPQTPQTLEVASITLQPPTPIDPTQPLDDPSPKAQIDTLSAPLALDLDLDSSPLSFGFDGNSFGFGWETPSIVPQVQDPKEYFPSLGLNFGGGGAGGEEGKGKEGGDGGRVERDLDGRLELPVLRAENLWDGEVEVEYVDEDGDDMSDQFDAATSFVSGFRETDLARAKVDPGHTGRTEKWLVGQGVTVQAGGIESLRSSPVNQAVVGPKEGESVSTIFRPRTAPPSSIPPSSIHPSQFTYVNSSQQSSSSHTLLASRLSLNAASLSPLDERPNVNDRAPSPVQTMINFEKAPSALQRGRQLSSGFGPKVNFGKVKEEEEEKRKKALAALSNQAFRG